MTQHRRRTSAKVFLCAAIGCAIVLFCAASLSAKSQLQSSHPTDHLYAPYVDMGLPADQHLVQIQQASGFKAVALAFLVAKNGCSAGWGGFSDTLPSDNLSNGTSILSLIQTLQHSGVQVILSFGGELGPEPALACTSATQLQALYQSVMDRYHVTLLDFDLEGEALTNQASLTLRDQALVGLKSANPGLILSYTLPVMPKGLDPDELHVLQTAQRDHLALDVVNLMVMNYGMKSRHPANMGLVSEVAEANAASQMSAAGLSSTIGLTPMLGVNDDKREVFQLRDAASLLHFAQTHPDVSRLGAWSLARDNGTCPGKKSASDACSGIMQSTYQFSRILNAF